MNALHLGVERLRVLNAATNGELYEALRYCKDSGSEQILRVTDAPPSQGAASPVLHLHLLAMAPDGTTRRHSQWTLDERHLDALMLAMKVQLREMVEAGKALASRVNEGLDAIDRDEDPPSWNGDVPDPEKKLS